MVDAPMLSSLSGLGYPRTKCDTPYSVYLPQQLGLRPDLCRLRLRNEGCGVWGTFSGLFTVNGFAIAV